MRGSRGDWLSWSETALRSLHRRRRDARAAGQKYFYPGPCARGHASPRYAVDSRCCACSQDESAAKSAAKRAAAPPRRDRRDKRPTWSAEELAKLPKSRGEAFELQAKYYVSGPCRRGHAGPRFASSGDCVLCGWAKDDARREQRIAAAASSVQNSSARKRRPKGKPGTIETMLYRAARVRAQEKGWVFTITVHDIEIPDRCPVLGIPIERVWGDGANGSTKRPGAPSLDRVDPRKGYVRGNVVVMSLRANILKGDGLPSEHERIAAFMRKRDTGRTGPAE